MNATAKVLAEQYARQLTEQAAVEIAQAKVRASTDRSWHVVYTEARLERLALQHLKRLGFETYQPQVRLLMPVAQRHLSHAQRQYAGKVMRERLVPLFPRYLLVDINPAAGAYWEIFKAVGVHGMVCEGDQPAALPPHVVPKLRALEVGGAIPGETPVAAICFGRRAIEPHGDVAQALGGVSEARAKVAAQEAQYQPGDTVQVMGGPFYPFTGRVEQLDESGRVRLLMSIFGRLTPATFEVSQVELVERVAQPRKSRRSRARARSKAATGQPR